MISVIIPARQEPYINKTIESLYDNASGEIEVIVVLDGENANIDSRAKVILHPTPLGRRVSMNEGAAIAKGEYLLHIDAHCSKTPEWDKKLQEVCTENTLVVSVVAAMNEDTWQIKPKHYYTFVSLNKNLVEKWWGKYKKLSDCAVTEETMALTGCGWMIRKDYYQTLGGCDESLGQLGHLGPEWALKVWCNSGRLILRTDVFCGHVFACNSKKIQPYTPQKISDADFKNRMYAKYGDKIEWLRDKFNPPGWKEEENIEVQEEVKITRRTKISNPEAYIQENKDKPWITCFLLYYGRYELAQEAMECFLAQTYPNKKLMIVNTHPDPVYFEEDLSNYEIEVHNLPVDMFLTLNHKYDWAFKHIKTDWFAPWDDDDIYLPWHLENLVENMKNTKPNGVPRKIGGVVRYASNGNTIRGFGGRMWSCCLFETFDKNNQLYAKCDTNVTQNADSQVKAQKWNEYWVNQTQYPMSFVYRWGTGEQHGSAHAGELGLEHAKKMREKKNKIPLKEPWRPHWKRNYIEDVKDFLRANPVAPKLLKDGRLLTSDDLLKLVPETL